MASFSPHALPGEFSADFPALSGYLTDTSAWFEPFEISRCSHFCSSVLLQELESLQELRHLCSLTRAPHFPVLCMVYNILLRNQNVTVKGGDRGGKFISTFHVIPLISIFAVCQIGTCIFIPPRPPMLQAGNALFNPSSAGIFFHFPMWFFFFLTDKYEFATAAVRSETTAKYL